MGVLKGPEGICQAVRSTTKIYPFCMCQQPAAPGEYYCQEHLDERKATFEKLAKAAKESAHIDGADHGA
jgi:hypothetical protein